MFEFLEDEGIMVPEEDRYYPYRITYDFESYFLKEDLTASSEKLTWEAKHEPLSVSICSNVPGFMDPKCFITVGKAEDLVMEMVNYLHSMQTTAQACVQEAHQTYYNDLVELLQQKQQLEENKGDTSDDDVIMDETEDKEKKSHPLYTVKLKYEQWMMQIPMIGFNSGKYDINMAKPHLVKVLMKMDAIKFVVKKSNSFVCKQNDSNLWTSGTTCPPDLTMPLI